MNTNRTEGPPDAELRIEEEDDALSLKTKMERLHDALKRCEEERKDYLDGWQRAKADFINARKAEIKERAAFFEDARVRLMEELLPFMDAFQAALQHADTNTGEGKGIMGLSQQLSQFLDIRGVCAFPAKGQRFNPKEHEAVETIAVDSPDKDEVVIAELQTGYRIGERILRPARVRVGVYAPPAGDNPVANGKGP